MLMADDKKGLASLIVGGMKKNSLDSMKSANQDAFEAHAAGEEKEEVDEGLLSAAREMIGAFERKDAEALALAFKNAIVLCEEAPSESEPEED